MKRYSKHLVCLALTLLLLSTACIGCAEPSPEAQTLYARGLQLVELVAEMAENESYFKLLSGSPELWDTLSPARAEDYAAPCAVYRVRITDDALYGLAGLDDPGKLSAALQAQTASRLLAALPSQLNACGGASTLAAATICTAGTCFVEPLFAENTLYLYVYESAAPIMVAFTGGEGGAVSAAAMPILFQGLQADCAEAVAQSLETLLGVSANVDSILP